MKVLLHNKKTETSEVVNYPRKDKKKLVGLSSDLAYYEIEESKKPAFNSNQYECIKSYELTENKGEFLLIAIEVWSLKERQKEVVINNLNISVGNHIDTNYPFWEQNKHSGKASRMLRKMVLGETPTEAELAYIAYVEACANWAASCRALRDDYEEIYLTEGVLPDLVWPERPLKE